MPGPSKKNTSKKGRRKFLKTVALGAGAVAVPGGAGSFTYADAAARNMNDGSQGAPRAEIEYPRRFTGRQLKMLSFPLGGVGAGSIALGGRGELREWWIFNRPDKGTSPQYAFPAIWVRGANEKPQARVLEARILPPYEGSSGLGSANVPGLPRLASCAFTGVFPLAHIDFEDSSLPVNVSLDAFTPFIPLEPDDSGLPVAILRYHVSNPLDSAAVVSIAFSIDNPIGSENDGGGSHGRMNETRQSARAQGLLMKNPFLPAKHPRAGTFALAILGASPGKVSVLRGWPAGRWWESPLLFWDDFSSDGALGPEAAARTA
ncbi:MAG: GH116 family glycosyl-hydrolase, partial [Terriglobia bacterium]